MNEALYNITIRISTAAMTILIIVALFYGLVFSQPKVLFFSGINSPTQYGSIDRTTFLERTWHTGISTGIGIEYPLFGSVTLLPSIEYDHYLFDSYVQDVRPPEYRLIASSGTATQIARDLVELRYYDYPPDQFRIYFSTGAGYIIERIGAVHVIWSDRYSNSDVIVDIRYPNSSYWVHSAGIGFQWKLGESYGVDGGWKYFSNYSDRFHFSMNVGVAYLL